jgi:hypothetical protein
MAALKLVAVLVSTSLCIATYTVDPVKCAGKLADDDCLLEGGSIMHKGKLGTKKETCLQCVIQRPGVETWGCTLDEIREWCDAGDGELPDIEKVPDDILEEERQNPKDFVDKDKFNAKHKTEMKLLHKKVNKGILQFANLLAKFDSEHPHFTATETLIMDGLINKHLSPHDALAAASTPQETDLAKQLEYVFEGDDAGWQPPSEVTGKAVAGTTTAAPAAAAAPTAPAAAAAPAATAAPAAAAAAPAAAALVLLLLLDRLQFAHL